MDECMQELEGTSATDPKYQEQQRACVAQLVNDSSFRWLPHVRLPVDERGCEPVNLCSGAPSDCSDTGEQLASDYRPGTVSKCFQLIGQSKATHDKATQTRLEAEVAQKCTNTSVWAAYARQKEITYCMSKHVASGICMNTMRTNCPEDNSCCPAAVNAAGGASTRENQYVCQKSPTVGLYCQHIDYRVPGAGNASERALCTESTCEKYAWCRDMADVPGLCLGESCRAYGRSLELSVIIVLCLAVAVLLDVVYVVLLARFPKPRKRALINMVGGCIKLLAYGFLIAGGIDDFVSTAVLNACFNAEGNERVAHAQDFAKELRLWSLLTMAASVAEAPVSMHYGSHLVGLPYIKSCAARGA